MPIRIRRLLTALALSAPLAAAPGPDYDRLKLFEVVALAEVVVAGEIAELREDSYDLRVDQWIAGAGPTNLRIERFEDWACAGRWGRYASGQRVLLFLEKSNEPGPWRALGAGNEGDVPFVRGNGVVPAYRVRGYPFGGGRLGERELYGTRLPADELIAAVRGFRETFRSEPGGSSDQVARIEPRSNLDAARAFAATSRTARHLFEQAYSSEAWPREPPATEQRAGSLPRVDPNEHELAGSYGAACALLDRAHLVAGARSGALLVSLGAGGARRVADLAAELATTLNERAGFGAAVASLGDLDGDGARDVLIGAPAWSGVANRFGGVWTLLLDGEGGVKRSTSLASSPILQRAAGVDPDGPIEGGLKRHAIGSALATLGDLDGDGTVEVAVAQEHSLWAERDPQVLVVSLSPEGGVERASAISSADLESEGANTLLRFGEALCGPGDVDGDGVADLAIGDASRSDGGDGRGAVWIVFLRADGTMRDRQLVSDWEGGFEGLLFDGASFGRALGAPGDVDGDGVVDLLAGSRQGLWLLFLTRAGTVREHRAIRDARHGFTDVGELGGSIACAPEREPDGALRLVVGGRDEEGGVLWLLRLRRDGTVAAW